VNNGRICLSICRPTADELVTAISSATADVVEARLDCLESGTEFEVVARIAEAVEAGRIKVPVIVTFRPKNEGGRRELSPEDRRAVWERVPPSIRRDLELDLAEQFPATIASFHSFDTADVDIDGIYNALASTGAEIIKIAIKSDDAVDGIALWRLLQRSTREGRPFVPIAMGDAGKWTRILGLAHGAYMTYASEGIGRNTAPGQFTYEDLDAVYRVKRLSTQTQVYGIVGNPVSSSLSPMMHNAAFTAHGLDAVFIPLHVNDLDAFMRRMVLAESREIDLNFHGFAVTMPHKRAVMRHLHQTDETARAIGAVNTIRIHNGRLEGFNTDASGFLAPLRRRIPDLQNVRVAIYGAGGAARACVRSLLNAGADVTVFARNERAAADMGVEHKAWDEFDASFDVIVNATPIGMSGVNFDAKFPHGDRLRNAALAYDLVTAEKTPLKRQADEAGVPFIGGLEMLIEQAAIQFEIWTGKPAPIDVMSAAAAEYR
jgi:3-dehydroquinate dehydratase / shikimate dehydrogenase